MTKTKPNNLTHHNPRLKLIQIDFKGPKICIFRFIRVRKIHKQYVICSLEAKLPELVIYAQNTFFPENFGLITCNHKFCDKKCRNFVFTTKNIIILCAMKKRSYVSLFKSLSDVRPFSFCAAVLHL